jgi:phosphoglycerate dehydrogenase-like enzyme
MGMLVWVPVKWAAQELTGVTDVTVEVVDPATVTELPASVADVEFYVPSFAPTPPTVAAMAKMPKLRVVQTLTAGVDALLPAMPPGVVLCNARGVHDASTAEWVLAAMLASLREIPGFARDQAAGQWKYRPTGSLAGKTVLIVGYGSIGAAVEARLSGFEVEVLRVARRARPGVSPVTELQPLLGRADVVVLLVPSTPQTAGMVDTAFLSSMKDGALLVNAARGTVVDTSALLAELTSGRLRAALDVTAPEPLPAGHPLWFAPGALITPHVAASTPLSGQRAARLVREQLDAYLRGEPLKNVITEAY